MMLMHKAELTEEMPLYITIQRTQKMNTNLVILPTRGRPANAARCVDYLLENSSTSDIVIAIDDDQTDLYPRIEGIMYEVGPRVYLAKTVNAVAMKYVDQYKTIHFIGDDSVVRTKDWDILLQKPILERGYGISYGDDLLQGENLPTTAMLSTNIIKTLGFMAPPRLKHLYVDNFWLALGNSLQCLDYLPEVIIEHLHFANGKAEKDAGYEEVNSGEMYKRDRQAFLDYLTDDLKADLEKLITQVVLPNGK
jgi:hypothetical protein